MGKRREGGKADLKEEKGFGGGAYERKYPGKALKGKLGGGGGRKRLPAGFSGGGRKKMIIRL